MHSLGFAPLGLRSLALLGSLCLLTLACADDGAASSGSDSGSESDPSESGTPGEADSSGEAESAEGPDEGETESETGTDERPPGPICPDELSEVINTEAIAAHLTAFAGIAAEHDGNRAAGTSGYEASAAYVEAQLQEAGYATTRWPFSFDRYVQFQPPTLARAGDQVELYTQGVDYAVPNFSPAGNVAALVEPVDLQLGLGNQSTSGCEPEDFAGFTPGSIALLQRGTCTFAVKAQNAEAAGAVAVLIFNQGDTEARMGLFLGSLGGQNNLAVPVLFTTYALGAELAEAAALAEVPLELSVDAGVVETETFNVIAETEAGDPERVVMLGAHLDSVPAGPGVNDNGTGSATVLELARQLAACSPNNKVRFAWWGGEEWGLHGSRQWVAALSDDELARLALYLNFDMLASPNFVRFVHNGAGGPEGSALLYESFLEWFDAHQLSTSGAGFTGNSDYQPFVDAGVPSGGLATGAGGSKSQQQAETYGGAAGQAYDACYHQACDDQDNFNLEVLGQNGQATAHVLQKWATDLGPLTATPKIVAGPGEVAAASVHECGFVHD
ncbi:MAG: M28 family peptidase [Enhygromyxa sp.]